MSTLNRSYLEVNINNISDKILKKNTTYDGELVTTKYILAFYLYMFYTQTSGRLRCNFRFIEPRGLGWNGQVAKNLAVNRWIKS